MLKIFKDAYKGFGRNECGTRAAALAYFTIFALPPLLILLTTIAGKIWSPDQVQHALEGQFSSMIGPGAAQQVHQMMQRGANSAGGGLLATVAGIIGLLLGATGAFLSLQDALNHAWDVEPDPAAGGVKAFALKRVLSLGMVLGLGFLLAVSLAVSAAVSALGGMLGGAMSVAITHAIDIVLSLAVLALLFAALFKFLPDGKVAWRDVWVGGAMTALLFVVGKVVIGLYLGHSKPGAAFGAASAFAVILVWIYYAGMIILYGAEFTEEWATQRGAGITPRAGATRVVRQEVRGGTGPARALPVAASARASTGSSAAPSRTTGSFGDWIVGLPVLYLIFRTRKRTSSDEMSRKA